MKLLLLSFVLLFSITPSPEIATVREHYVSAATSQQSADSFYKALENITESHNDKTLLAYKAASIVLLAKYDSGIFSKTRLFNRGTDLLEIAIKQAPDNYEARLIRLNIQDNVPWITGYTGEIKADKIFLAKNYARQSEDLKAFTKKYILQSDAFNAKEKVAFN